MIVNSLTSGVWVFMGDSSLWNVCLHLSTTGFDMDGLLGGNTFMSQSQGIRRKQALYVISKGVHAIPRMIPTKTRSLQHTEFKNVSESHNDIPCRCDDSK
eukprot:3777825-Amphidinium_carterae.1